ncbi:MAG TPA: BadF/BadG/BcrA/BcrD ATPase family protein [Dictyobacter sp.]|jgi:N-acetylglucosamine kinase-like BadF-type ATPase|nr:BadF/BadG/BcrA/BcrD ATPase family protein [Dictyobacter sp.]
MVQSEQTSAYYLGIDGGGSKTLAIIVNEQGQEVGRGVSGCSNLAAIGVVPAAQHILDAVAQARDSLPSSVALHRAWLGVAGVDRPADYDLLFPHVEHLATSVSLTNDADLLLSALPGVVGIALIAGTGSIALGRNVAGKYTRAGGWGHILGDEGSGYALGQQALQAAVRAADGRGEQTSLLATILSHWHLQTPEDIIGQVYTDQEDKASIARLSTCVLQEARRGDAVATRIVQHATHELSLHVQTVWRALGYTAEQPVPLALGGGLLLHEDDYQQRFLLTLRQQQAVGTVVRVEQPALSAAHAIIHVQL